MRHYLAVLPALTLALTGCRPGAAGVSRTYDKPVPPSPPAGMVRIVPEQLKSDGQEVHWRWTVVGDRNWARTSLGIQDAELSESFPLDAPGRIGTNAYEVELRIKPADAPGGKTDLDYEFSLKTIGVRVSGPLNGSIGSGGGGSGSGRLRSGLKKLAADRAAQVLLTEELTLPLPVEKSLLEVKAEEADGKPFQHAFRLKLAK